MKDVLFVGQAPGPTWRPGDQALGGACGERLGALLGLTVGEFLGRYATANVLDRYPGRARGGSGDRFSVPEARWAAVALLERAPRLVLCGAGVVAAFSLRALPLDVVETDGRRALHLPHPSRVNRWWNAPDAAARASRALREFVA